MSMIPRTARERRQAERLPDRALVNVIVQLHRDTNGRAGEFVIERAFSRDISAGGMCFTCPYDLTEQNVLLLVKLRAAGYRYVEAEIVDKQPCPTGGWSYHVSFKQWLDEPDAQGEPHIHPDV